MDYLYRGGRISSTSAVLGGILHIKPIINVEDGKLVPIEKTRGRKKAIRRLFELVGERGKNLEKQILAISHGDIPDEAQEVKEMLMEKYKCKDVIINTIGCVIGAHVGPGTLALFFLNEALPF